MQDPQFRTVGKFEWTFRTVWSSHDIKYLTFVNQFLKSSKTNTLRYDYDYIWIDGLWKSWIGFNYSESKSCLGHLIYLEIFDKSILLNNGTDEIRHFIYLEKVLTKVSTNCVVIVFFVNEFSQVSNLKRTAAWCLMS